MEEACPAVRPFQGSAAAKGIFDAAKCGDLPALQHCIAADDGCVFMRDETTL
jgi:hypothetical protein